MDVGLSPAAPEVESCRSRMAVADFAESHLGTMEYWEGVYRRELAVFQESDDVGEIWFGAQCLRRVLERVESLFGLEERATAKVLDVGTGNGYTLIKLEKKLGFAGVLVGTDYAPAAVEFAQKVAVSAGCTCVQFVTDDILDSSLIATHAHSFDLVLDKGTFDAISLRGDAKEARQNYIDTIIALLVPTTGRFLITSCNWTHDELLAQYLPAGFVYEGKIDYPTFSFGGGKGSTVASIIFTRPALSKTSSA